MNTATDLGPYLSLAVRKEMERIRRAIARMDGGDSEDLASYARSIVEMRGDAAASGDERKIARDLTERAIAMSANGRIPSGDADLMRRAGAAIRRLTDAALSSPATPEPVSAPAGEVVEALRRERQTFADAAVISVENDRLREALRDLLTRPTDGAARVRARAALSIAPGHGEGVL